MTNSDRQDVAQGEIPASWRETPPAKMWLANAADLEPRPPTSQSARQGSARRVLLLVDDPDQGHWLLDELRQAGVAVAWSTKGREGLTLVRSGLVDLVVAEMGLPDLPGLDLLREIGDLPVLPKVILTTSRQSDYLAARAIEHGASAVLSKPYAIDQLLGLVVRLLAN
jgi:DNA-binding response OmpR family regulator